MSEVQKAFGATRALNRVSFDVGAGEVHALIGENGAGKSTLMKILSGVYPPDGGEIELDGRPWVPANPLHARHCGIVMIYQELTLAPHLSVEENILLGEEPAKFGWLNRRRSVCQSSERNMPAMRALLLCLPAILVATVNAQNTALTFQSSGEQTALIELYTSEGCSSCPPAETWLSRLQASPRLWKDFVPLAFHVDYWDYLGWRDPWANKSFSDRQRAYAKQWRSDSIYTPGFVLNGKEWRDWSEHREGPKATGVKAGVLTVSSSDTNRWQVSFASANTGGADYEVHAALLAGGLSSDVKAGENRGRHLSHDFVVLTFVHASLVRSGDGAQGEFVLSKRRNAAASNLALAVWLTPAGRLEPLQATGGWLARPASSR